MAEIEELKEETQSKIKLDNNFSITNLFIKKQIKVFVNDSPITINCKTVRDFFDNSVWNMTYHLMSMNITDWKKILSVDYTEVYQFICLFIFELGKYKQYNKVVDNLKNGLIDIFPELIFNWKEKSIEINSITITPEIWNYLVYVVKLYCGEKVTQPLTFDSPEAQAFFLKQQEMEDRINKVKEKAGRDNSDGVIKSILAITYSFPSMTVDYLLDQTMAQIHWLSKMAAGEVSYKFNAQAYAAGNVKKGKKLDFFIK